MTRGQLLEEFEKYQQRVARAMIDGGEGKRARQIVNRISFEDFEAGWKAAIESAGLTLKE